MTRPPNYTSRFTNRYGEEWQFGYDATSGEGVLRGSDVDWQAYRVVGAQAQGLVLNEEELMWLRQAWREATSQVPRESDSDALG